MNGEGTPEPHYYGVLDAWIASVPVGILVGVGAARVSTPHVAWGWWTAWAAASAGVWFARVLRRALEVERRARG